MVIAHPDDEILFGGQELLISKNWLVVCLTNGNQLSRKNQFFNALLLVGAQGIIWEYPRSPRTLLL